MILTGKVNCLLSRNVAFKSYIQGSYFGDIEVFRNELRLFSTRAETDTILVTLDYEYLNQILRAHPLSYHNLYKQTMLRYIRYKITLVRIEDFKLITMNNKFWENEDPLRDMLNEKIDTWVDLVSKPEKGGKKNHNK